MKSPMARRIHVFEQPDRFVADAVGVPGQRTFYLQARQADRLGRGGLQKHPRARPPPAVTEAAARRPSSRGRSSRTTTRRRSTTTTPTAPTCCGSSWMQRPCARSPGVRRGSWPEVGCPARCAASCSTPRATSARAGMATSTEAARLLLALREGALTLDGGRVEATNASFVGVARLLGDGFEVRCVYKPIAGERPLWDFPDGTPAHREVAAYLVSEAAGWDVVPPTAFREDGPLGPGMAQQWIEAGAEMDLA